MGSPLTVPKIFANYNHQTTFLILNWSLYAANVRLKDLATAVNRRGVAEEPGQSLEARGLARPPPP